MDALRTDDIVFRTEQLDGPWQGIVIRDALITPWPIELVDVLEQAPVLVDAEYALKAFKGGLIVEMQPITAGDGVRLTVAHVTLDRRHALLDLDRIVGPDVDVGDNVETIASGLQVEANPDIGIGHYAVEQTRLEMPLDISTGQTLPVLPTVPARDLPVESMRAAAAI